LELPSGSVPVNGKSKNLQRVLVNGVPDSYLSEMLNEIVPQRREDVIKNISASLLDGRYLKQEYSLLAPVVDL
jgi:hypothetical protein